VELREIRSVGSSKPPPTGFHPVGQVAYCVLYAVMTFVSLK
jgi:hypothetical protein